MTPCLDLFSYLSSCVLMMNLICVLKKRTCVLSSYDQKTWMTCASWTWICVSLISLYWRIYGNLTCLLIYVISRVMIYWIYGSGMIYESSSWEICQVCHQDSGGHP